MSRNQNSFYNNSGETDRYSLMASKNYMNDPPGLKTQNDNNADYIDSNRTYAPISNRSVSPSRSKQNNYNSNQPSRATSRISLTPNQRTNSPTRNFQNPQQKYSPKVSQSRYGGSVSPPSYPGSDYQPPPPILVPNDLINFRQQPLSPPEIILPPVINVESINFILIKNTNTNTNIFELNVNSLRTKKFGLKFAFIKANDSIFITGNESNVGAGVSISEFEKFKQHVGSNSNFKIFLQNQESSVMFSYQNKVFIIKVNFQNYIESMYEILINSEEQKIQIQSDLMKIFHELQDL
jgi:hypothetical protein